ncbi:MAG: amidohydrolase family protein [Phormidesmis sp. RL_2_1]|nr:amidohydrolase family protein [Phormidesmis sp. RL_2_1]
MTTDSVQSTAQSTAQPATVQLVRGRWVFTDIGILCDGAVAVQGENIIEVGSWERLRDRYPQAIVLGSPHHAVLPGLINAHHHSNGVPNTLLGIEDDFLELWLYARSSARWQDPSLKTLLSTAALLQSGVTSVVDMATIGSSLTASQSDLQAQLQAYEQAGIRVALAPGAKYDSFLVHGPQADAAFLKTLPKALQQQVRALTPPEQTLNSQDYLTLVSNAVKQYKAHPRIDVWFGPPGPQWVGDELLIKIAEAAEQLDTGVQTHVMESLPEKLIGPRFYGRSVIAHLHNLGVLSPRFSMAHGVWVTAQDIEILAETGASISHNPSSNLRLRAGVAPLAELLAQGVTVGLGMDGTTLNDDEDMFTEMRLAARLARSPQMNSAAPTLTDIFHMSTAGGAKLMRQAHSIGKLAAGYKADVLLVKGVGESETGQVSGTANRITWPYLAPEADPLTVVMMRAKAMDVDTVLVNGQIVLKDGQPTQFDVQQVYKQIATQLKATADKAAYRALAKAIRPFIAQWYADWQIPELTPFAAFNSRY